MQPIFKWREKRCKQDFIPVAFCGGGVGVCLPVVRMGVSVQTTTPIVGRHHPLYHLQATHTPVDRMNDTGL